MANQWLVRVKARAAELNMTMEELARTAKLDRSYFRKVQGRPNATPRGDTLTELAKVLQVEPNWILGQGTEAEPAAPKSQGSHTSEHLVMVPEIDGKGGAGSASGGVMEAFRLSEGGYQSSDAIKEEWGVPSTFLRYEARIPNKAANILEVIGDSMFDPINPNAAGSLHPGDRAIIDTQDRLPSPPGTFALWDGFGIVFKMVEIVHGSEPTSLRLISKNPAYRPYEVTLEEANIIGRVKGRVTIY